MGLLSDKELGQLVPADQVDSGTPIPTRLVSSDEYLPIRQTERQKQVEARMNELGDDYGRRNGLSRRRFFRRAGFFSPRALSSTARWKPRSTRRFPA